MSKNVLPWKLIHELTHKARRFCPAKAMWIRLWVSFEARRQTGRFLPRVDRSFTAEDVLRIIERNLDEDEKHVVLFELLQRPVRDAFAIVGSAGKAGGEQSSLAGQLERRVEALALEVIRQGAGRIRGSR